MALSRVASFSVELDKRHYFAGETVQGSVFLRTTAPIACRSVKFSIKGVGYSRFYTGSGDKRERRDHKVHYWRDERTLWGRYHRTDEIDDAGANAIWGSPFSPNGGVMVIAVEQPAAPLVLRVMDEDWGKRDDLLGEILVYPEEAVEEAASHGGVTQRLMLNGRRMQGTITYTARWEDENEVPRRLRLEVIAAIGLRSADWFGKNDIYVQVYSLPPGAAVKKGHALPPPNGQAMLPAGDHYFPLPSFKLPDDLPASFEEGHRYGHEYAYVRYFAEASIDIKWGLDPFTRILFTVLPRLPTSLGGLEGCAKLPSKVKKVHPPCYVPPFCCDEQCQICECTCIDNGCVALSANVSDRVGAPGERLLINAMARNKTSTPCQFFVRLVRHARFSAEGRVFPFRRDILLHKQKIRKGGLLELENLSVTIPLKPASYHGGLLANEQWEQTLRKYDMGYSNSWFARRRTDPVVWWYRLEIGLDIPSSKFDLICSSPFTVTAVPKSVLPNPVEMAPACWVMDDDSNPQRSPGYLPVKVGQAVPLQTVVAASASPSAWVSGDVVQATMENDVASNACCDLAYAPEYFVPGSQDEQE